MCHQRSGSFYGQYAVVLLPVCAFSELLVAINSSSLGYGMSLFLYFVAAVLLVSFVRSEEAASADALNQVVFSCELIYIRSLASVLL